MATVTSKQRGTSGRRPTPKKATSSSAARGRGAAPKPVDDVAEPALDHGLLAVMDVGSRALRLGIGEVMEGRPLRRLETLDAPVAIGVDTFSQGRIRATTTEAVVHTLEDFALVLRDYGLKPRDVHVVATSAVRDATNREVFLDRIEKRTGYRIVVIDAIEETRLARQLVRHLVGPSLDEGVVMLLAFGGGGTQLIVQRDAAIVVAESRQFGILKLQEAGPIEPALRSARRFLPKVVRSIARIHDLESVERIVVVSTDVLRFVAGLGEPEEHPWGLSLSRSAFDRLEASSRELTTKQVAKQTGLERGAAELAFMAFEELRAFVAPCGFESVLLPRCSMLDSVMLDSALSLAGTVDSSTRDLPATIESSAWALARKYRISESHIQQVRALALQLFDQLVPLTGLDARARLLLSVAAILHDIGIYVGTTEHERHSAYLIANSEVMGLDSAELRRVALVVRHHRAPFRDIDSRDLGLDVFAAGQRDPLLPAERVEVLKLTALLRVADALDTNHFCRAVQLRVDTTHEELHVVIETRAGDREGFLDLQRAFAAKADLAEEVFGMKLKLIEVLAE